jgi:hypothetical protein
VPAAKQELDELVAWFRKMPAPVRAAHARPRTFLRSSLMVNIVASAI